VADSVRDESPKRTSISDPKVMRALAHPARLTILEELGLGRAGTATEFAAICGLTPSATSYHLRALAKAGLVQEAPGRGDGREWVWQLVSAGGIEITSGPDGDPEAMRAEQGLVEVWLARSEARTRSWVARWPQESREWYHATRLTEQVIDVTPEELTELNTKVYELVLPYSRSVRREPPPNSRAIAIVYRTVPLPDKPDKSDEA
jgi:DNA-binding transcriptional ArsR family regulator